MSVRNSSSVGGRQTGDRATVTDTATATGRDERREVGRGNRAGAGIETDMQVVTGLAPSAEVGTETVTEVLTCCRASASVWPSC
jgi:hypothetical protein